MRKCGPDQSMYDLASFDSSWLSLWLGADTITACEHVRLLSVMISSDLSLEKHVTTVCSQCFYWLRQMKLLYALSWHRMWTTARSRPITARNFRRRVVRFSIMFKNISCWPTFIGRQNWQIFLPHEGFLSPDNIDQLLSVVSSAYCRKKYFGKVFCICQNTFWKYSENTK